MTFMALRVCVRLVYRFLIRGRVPFPSQLILLMHLAIFSFCLRRTGLSPLPKRLTAFIASCSVLGLWRRSKSLFARSSPRSFGLCIGVPVLVQLAGSFFRFDS
uniref:Uncharacterized protein n=1 Tax=Physcomitrium patens TaxID=3218 RepID=A0A2K1JII9_PHYPA|nr:hypothetical protein PHYPA_018775 [Physcomitrium patens]